MPCPRQLFALLFVAAWLAAFASARGEGKPSSQHSNSQRELVTQELASARAASEQTRMEALAARKRLDDFLAAHFTGGNAPAPPTVSSESELRIATHPEQRRLEAQLGDLRAERDKLLGSLTEAHPEVVDVDERIAVVEARILAFGANPNASGVAQHAADVSRQWSEYLDQHKARSGRDAAEFQRLFQDWQQAQQAWDTARAVETVAADRLAALGTVDTKPTGLPLSIATHGYDQAPAQLPPATPGEPPRKASPAPPATLTSNRSSDSAQALALAALLVALAIAALAAVRLARSSADPIFASADEAAAALAIPVIGIVPALRRSETLALSAFARRTLVVATQVLIAIAVFSLIAYLMRNAEQLWNDPLAFAHSLLGL